MGQKSRNYKKTLHQQVYDRLTEMQAFGQSKHEGMADGSSTGKIYSFATYQTYKKHINYFVKWVRDNYPECHSLNRARKYINEWLQQRVDQGLSAWTISLEASALNKLYGISKDDPMRFIPPPRRREDITRSRVDALRDKHFSVTNNFELICFCRGTGLRRAGLESIRGRDLLTRDQIEVEINRIESIPKEKRSAQDEARLRMCMDTRLFDRSDQMHFVRVTEKGGRERIAPIIGSYTDQIVDRFRRTEPDKRVWSYVHSGADIHSYRADYACALYKQYARDVDQIPYDRVKRNTGQIYQSQVYICRGDEAGKKLDRHAMYVASKALGHNRIDVIAQHYLRAL